MPHLQRIATGILEPIYGDQSKALNEWITGKGHKHAFVIIHKKAIIGLLSVKAHPKKSYLKISTLIVLPTHNGNGCGSKMMEDRKSVV